jgi:uncharacterized protein YvpB
MAHCRPCDLKKVQKRNKNKKTTFAFMWRFILNMDVIGINKVEITAQSYFGHQARSNSKSARTYAFKSSCVLRPPVHL